MLSALLDAFVSFITAVVITVTGIFSTPVSEPHLPVEGTMPTASSTQPISVSSSPSSPQDSVSPTPPVPVRTVIPPTEPRKEDRVVAVSTQVSTPPVLPATLPIKKGETKALDPEQIITLTNEERGHEGLSSLSADPLLTAMAEEKAKDMIARQYFAHESPDGVDVSGLADKFGYQYRYIGENLALGDLGTSVGVVTGWMNSPGHRKNILNPNYTEIGVAAVRGPLNSEGRDVWYAVQEFGDPVPDCPPPSKIQKTAIIDTEAKVESIGELLTTMRAAIEEPGISETERMRRADEYNGLVDSYNALLQAEKKLVSDYNSSVQAFNACMEG